jgi:hypothetical protein
MPISLLGIERAVNSHIRGLLFFMAASSYSNSIFRSSEECRLSILIIAGIFRGHANGASRKSCAPHSKSWRVHVALVGDGLLLLNAS